VLTALGATLLLAACSTATGAPDETPSPTPSVTVPLRTVDVGPAEPDHGALFGAWVTPEVYTQEGRVQAVQDFESRIGRPLAFVHVFHDFDDAFPSPADLAFVQRGSDLLLSWSGTDTRSITAGDFDATIRGMAQSVKALKAPIWIRWRWEMNRPNLRSSVWGPADYVAAWRHIRAIFTAEGVTNAAWVWCPLASKFTSDDGAAYYPGDDEVDWLCADVYPEGGRSFADVIGPFMAWAAGHPQPVMIAEFGASADAGVDRSAWLTAAFDYVEHQPRIKALAYFEGVTEGPPPYDYRLQPGTPELAALSKAVNRPYFRAGVR
jgi:hypothetical protein